MTVKRDDIRPRGTVEVTCPRCGWSYWLNATDPLLPDGPFVCVNCEIGPKTYRVICTSCTWTIACAEGDPRRHQEKPVCTQCHGGYEVAYPAGRWEPDTFFIDPEDIEAARKLKTSMTQTLAWACCARAPILPPEPFKEDRPMAYQPVQLARVQNDASGMEAAKNDYLTALAARDAQVSALAVAEADLAAKKAAVTTAANVVKADADTYIPA